MLRNETCNRRSALKILGAGAAGALAVSAAAAADTPKPRGNIKQSVCRWCYGRIPLEKLARAAKEMGYQSIELLSPTEYLKIKPLGMTCAMIGGADIANGLNRKENHAKIARELSERIEFAAAEGLPNVICMSGNRRGLADDEGLKTCAVGLKEVLKLAEQKKVNVVMEGLNSKVNHKDYMYDRTSWGAELCNAASPRRASSCCTTSITCRSWKAT